MKPQFRARPAGSVLVIVLILALSLGTIIGINDCIAALRLKGEPLPEYGTWTGIATLNKKVTLLRQFASRSPVDAVIIGSSVSDHGLSAEILSRDLSAAYGREFRVFNLSTGGAEAITLLPLYRLAHVIGAPKQIWITFPAEHNIGDVIYKESPDYALQRSPIGIALRHPFLLPLSFRLFQIPLVRDARALSDLATYRAFLTRPASHLDIYDFDAHGDSRGFQYYTGAEPFSKYVALRRALILSHARAYQAAAGERAKTAVYFSAGALQALAEIRAEAARDHCAISILAHDSSAGFAAQNESYLEASDLFYKEMSERLGAPVIDARASFHLARYKFSDTSHLNAIGADEMSHLIAAKMTNRSLPRFPEYPLAPEVSQSAPDPKLTAYTAVVLHKASDATAGLELRYVQGPGEAPLTPQSKIQLVVLLPDNQTLAVPAGVVSRGHVIADTSKLPESTGGQVLFLQLTLPGQRWGSGVNLPLSSYRWSAITPSLANISASVAKVSTAEGSYTPLRPIRGYWSNIEDPMAKDWVGVFPVGGDNGTRLSMKWTGGGSAGQFELPSNPSAKPGQYEVRLYANDGWDLLASSAPFSIIPLATTVEPTPNLVRRGGKVHAAWRKLDSPSKDDWVGLFPAGGPNPSRLDFKYTGGKSEGAVGLTVPAGAPPGAYELRLYAAGGWGLLATSAPFQVVDSRVGLTVDRAVIRSGGIVQVRWTGMESPAKDDWIGLFSKGQTRNVRALYHLTGGVEAGELSFAIPPGTVAGDYEFRLYRHDGWQLAATSEPLRILSEPVHHEQQLPVTAR